MESVFDLKSAKALLEWHAELGISEAISERPINRFESKVEANLGPKTSEPKDNPVNILPDNPTGEAVMVSANAVEYSMSGGLQTVYSTQDSPTEAETANGKGLTTQTDLSFNASGVNFSNGMLVAAPALATTTVIGPRAERAALNASITASRSVTSQTS